MPDLKPGGILHASPGGGGRPKHAEARCRIAAPTHGAADTMPSATPIRIAALIALACCAAPAPAADYPSKPVRFIVPTAAGGPSDTLARAVGTRLSQNWGQSVVVDNRGGAGGTIGTDIAAKSPADGHTLLLASNAAVINVSLYSKLPYDFATDFAPVTQLGETPFVLAVHPAVPVKSVRELIALAKAKPGTLSYGSAGVGVASHLSGAIFQSNAGIDVVHVPYKGQAPATADLLAGQIAYMFNNPITCLPLIKAGRLRALAVSGARRFAMLPDTPTVAESGLPGFDVTVWFSVVVPAGTPAPVIERLNHEIVAILHLPEVRERLEAQGVEIIGNSTEAFARAIKADIVKWAAAVKQSGARAD